MYFIGFVFCVAFTTTIDKPLFCLPLQLFLAIFLIFCYEICAESYVHTFSIVTYFLEEICQ